MVAERRDLIVATYSSVVGTGTAATVTVCTGIACIAGPWVCGWALPQPVRPPTATTAARRKPIFVCVFTALVLGTQGKRRQKTASRGTSQNTLRLAYSGLVAPVGFAVIRRRCKRWIRQDDRSGPLQQNC